MPRFSFLVLSMCLIVQASLFYGFSRGEKAPQYHPLAGFPPEIGGWRMVRQGVIQQEVKDILRADDYITREYQESSQEYRQSFRGVFQIAARGANASFAQELPAGIGLGLDCSRHHSGNHPGPHADCSKSLPGCEGREQIAGSVLVPIAGSRGGERIQSGGFRSLGRHPPQPDRHGAGKSGGAGSKSQRRSRNKSRRGVHPGVLHHLAKLFPGVMPPFGPLADARGYGWVGRRPIRSASNMMTASV